MRQFFRRPGVLALHQGGPPGQRGLLHHRGVCPGHQAGGGQARRHGHRRYTVISTGKHGIEVRRRYLTDIGHSLT